MSHHLHGDRSSAHRHTEQLAPLSRAEHIALTDGSVDASEHGQNRQEGLLAVGVFSARRRTSVGSHGCVEMRKEQELHCSGADAESEMQQLFLQEARGWQ